MPDGMRPDLLAVLQEALSNAVRHARATQVAVAVHVDSGRATITVQDDGVGAGAAAARGGLANMRERAGIYGGEFTIESAKPRGTLVRWTVPLRD